MTRPGGWHPLVALLIGVAVASIALVPAVGRRLRAHLSPYTPVFNHLLDHGAVGREPDTLRPVRFDSIRTASRLVPPETTYYLYTGQSDPLLAYTVRGVTTLYLSDKFPVSHPTDAKWILSYRAPTVTPPGVRARRVVSLGGGVYLLETRGP